MKNNILLRVLAISAGLILGSMISISAQAAPARTIRIDGCLTDGHSVFCDLSMSEVPQSDDGYVYLYADEVYQDGPSGKLLGKTPLSSIRNNAAGGAEFQFPLNNRKTGSALSQKFLAAVKQGGRMVQISDEHYITNPEAAAVVPVARMDKGIKGILADPLKILNGELQDLNLDQASYNIYLGDICGPSTDPAYPTIPFTYEGITYQFDGGMMAHYDYIIRNLTEMDLQVTVNLLNNGSPKAPDLIHPLARDGHSAPNYAFNTVEPGGTQHLKAIAAFLAEHYNGHNGHGQIDNWIIGNEVNARTEQFYMASDDLDFNVNTYVKAFRIFYNGIKSVNGSARIYNSIDQEWNRKSNPGSFLSREYMDQFNYYILREGNIDYGLSFHPYNAPLYDPYTWLGLSRWVKHDLTTPYITMQNLYLLTDYMQQPQYLNPYGAVRSISLSEIGFTSSFGDDLQAASIIYAYEVARNNPFVDSFMLFRLTDDAHEMESMLAEGLDRLDGSHKPAYEYYRSIQTPDYEIYRRKANAIIGTDVSALARLREFPTREGE